MYRMFISIPFLLLGQVVYCQNFQPGLQRQPNTFLRHPSPNGRFERPSLVRHNALLPNRKVDDDRWNKHPNSGPFIAGATPFTGPPAATMGDISLNPRPQYSFEYSPPEEEQPIYEDVSKGDEVITAPNDDPVLPAEDQVPEAEVYTPAEEEETIHSNSEYIPSVEVINDNEKSDLVKSADSERYETEGAPIEKETQFDQEQFGESENFDYFDDEASKKQKETYKHIDAEYEYQDDYPVLNDESAIQPLKREVSEFKPPADISFNPSEYYESDKHEQTRETESNAFIKSPLVNQEAFYENFEHEPKVDEYSPSQSKPQYHVNSQDRYSNNAQSYANINHSPPEMDERAEERQDLRPYSQSENSLQPFSEPHSRFVEHQKTPNLAAKKRRPYKPFWESQAPGSGQKYLNEDRYPSEAHEQEETEDKPDRLSLLLLETKFRCESMKDGYYADEELDCEVFHFCRDKVRHSWLCPNGASFHQVHLICMPKSEDNICEKSSEFHFVNDYLYKEAEGSHAKNKSYVQRYYPAGYEGGIALLEERQASADRQAPRQPQEEQSFDRDYAQGPPSTRLQKRPHQVQSGPLIEQQQFHQDVEPEYHHPEMYQDQYNQRNEQRVQRNPNIVLRQQHYASNTPQHEYSYPSRPGASFLVNEDETTSIRRAPYVHRRLREH